MIKDKAHFILGMIDLIAGIACLLTCLYMHRGAKIVLTFVPILCGMAEIKQSTRK